MAQKNIQTLIIESVWPEIDCGRYPIKRCVGDTLVVEADIFSEGHGVLAAVLKHKVVGEEVWQETPMDPVDNDRFRAAFSLEQNACYLYTLQAWRDEFASWRSDTEKKVAAGQKVTLDLEEGKALLLAAATRAGSDRRLAALLTDLEAGSEQERMALLVSQPLQRLMARYPDRSRATSYPRELRVWVDRPVARFSTWYEMFPRSQGKEPGKSATFADCEARLPEIAAMGFDVVYLVPIHPVGHTHRKGPDNSLTAGPGDPGSPYAIGNDHGGYDAVHPDLGTFEDFRRFVARARELGIEVALDFAIQCSPDHPYIKEHPEWFIFRPDGTIKYAENPPKKYQDIVNVNFYGPHREALWREMYRVICFWVEQGVTIFRVDNPHTKPVAFWEWLIEEVQARYPEVLFLSEAFTRPKPLKALAKAGFSQSYTYFTWRNFKEEFTQYLTELSSPPVSEYLRPNFFTNTPDILPPILQTGGRAAFQMRAVLAGTLSPSYGIYNSFELCEAAAIPETEEYLHSEKYQYKVWDWDRPGNIKEYLTRLNAIRRENSALQHLTNLQFYPASNENVLFYGKMNTDGSGALFIAVNLDPFEPQSSTLTFPLHRLGIQSDQNYQVEELLGNERHLWQGSTQEVTLNPDRNPAAIYRVSPWEYRDFGEPSF